MATAAVVLGRAGHDELVAENSRLKKIKEGLSRLFNRLKAGDASHEPDEDEVWNAVDEDEEGVDAEAEADYVEPLSTRRSEVDDGPVKFHVAASVRNIEDWDDVKTGYMSLMGYIVFVVLFFIVLAMQVAVEQAFETDRLFREVIALQGDALEEVKSMEGMWTFWLGDQSGSSAGGAKKKKSRTKKKGGGGSDAALGLIPQLFPESAYNDAGLSPDESGFVESYHKLVGGVLLVQSRYDEEECDPNSLFSTFYGTCVGALGTTPFGPFKNSSTWCDSPPSQYAGLTGFCYSKSDQGFAQFLPVADGLDANLGIVTELRANKWTDKFTQSVHVKWSTYNGNLRLFTFVDMTFSFSRGGGILSPINVVIQSVRMELYNTTIDYVRLVLEMLLILSIGYQVAALISGIVRSFRRGRGFAHLRSLWTMVDIVNLGLFVVSVVLRVTFVYSTFASPIVVPTTSYQVRLEDAAGLQRLQMALNAFNVFLCLFRFFKFYAFQDRLSLLTETFSRAWTDLYHFLIMFLAIFFGYSLIGFLLFGPHMYEYSAFDRALSSQYEMMLNNYDFGTLSRINGPMASVYLVSFVFIVGILLINVLLAILVDAYSHVSSAGDLPARTVHQQLGLMFHRAMQWSASLQRKEPIEGASTADLLEALYRTREKGVAEATLGEIEELSGASNLHHKAYMLLPVEGGSGGANAGIVRLENECGLLMKENERLREQIEMMERRGRKSLGSGLRRGWVQRKSGKRSRWGRSGKMETVWAVAQTSGIFIYEHNVAVDRPPLLEISIEAIRRVEKEGNGTLRIILGNGSEEVWKLDDGEEAASWATAVGDAIMDHRKRTQKLV